MVPVAFLTLKLIKICLNFMVSKKKNTVSEAQRGRTRLKGTTEFSPPHPGSSQPPKLQLLPAEKGPKVNVRAIGVHAPAAGSWEMTVVMAKFYCPPERDSAADGRDTRLRTWKITRSIHSEVMSLK